MRKLYYICVNGRSCQVAFRVVGSQSLNFALWCQYPWTFLCPCPLFLCLIVFLTVIFVVVYVCLCSPGPWDSAHMEIGLGKSILVSLVFQLFHCFRAHILLTAQTWDSSEYPPLQGSAEPQAPLQEVPLSVNFY